MPSRPPQPDPLHINHIHNSSIIHQTTVNMHLVSILPLFVAAAHAIPYYQIEKPSAQPVEEAISKRQSEGVSWLCAENSCDLSSCPMSLEFGSGKQFTSETFFLTYLCFGDRIS